MVQRILLPTQFSPACEKAREHARIIAERTGAQIHVLHVQVMHANEWGWGGVVPAQIDNEQALSEAASSGLARFCTPIGDRAVPATTSDISAAAAIVRYADDNDIDLILMGTHGRKGLAQLFLGSEAAEVTRAASVPVMVVGGEHTAPAPSYRTILCGFDFSAHALGALDEAARLARAHSARLIIAHVVDSRPLPPYQTDSIEAAEVDHARQALQTRLANAGLDDINWEIIVSAGAPWRELNDMARELGADLIIMGTAGLSGLDHLLLGSVTERVMRAAPCPVLAWRGETAEDL